MKVFITGASGFIGSQATRELIANGHSVLGLARSDASAEKLKDMGAEVVRGTLEDSNVLAESAKKCDGVMHFGFIHDFSNMEHSHLVDHAAITTMCEAIVGTDKFFIGTSGVLVLVGLSGDLDEDTVISDRGSPIKVRLMSDDLVLSYSKKGIKANVVRLAPTIHDVGDHGFIPMIYDMAKKHGNAVFPGDGSNVWPSCHRKDIAVLYRLIAEQGISGKILHGVGETGVSIEAITKAMAEKGNLKHESVAAEDLSSYYGPFFGFLLNMNADVSSVKTQKLLGWKPSALGLIEDMIKNY